MSLTGFDNLLLCLCGLFIIRNFGIGFFVLKFLKFLCVFLKFWSPALAMFLLKKDGETNPLSLTQKSAYKIPEVLYLQVFSFFLKALHATTVRVVVGELSVSFSDHGLDFRLSLGDILSERIHTFLLRNQGTARAIGIMYIVHPLFVSFRGLLVV